MRALGGRNAAILSSLSDSRASDGLDARIARAHRANARASPIDPSADLARRAARLRLGDRICSTSADSADIRETVMCPARGDRKSTRLNSSHGSISYAVFFLKKKNSLKPLLCTYCPVLDKEAISLPMIIGILTAFLSYKHDSQST